MSAAMPRRVLIVHNAYQQRGGEDVAVERQAALLREAGIAADIALISNDKIDDAFRAARALVTVRGNRAQVRELLDLAMRKRAELIHIHNFFPLISPLAHTAFAQRGFPVVQTLHNFRLLCANGMLMRNAKVCELCLGGSRFNAVRHRCYRNSSLGSAAVLRMQNASIRSARWKRSVGKFIALTEFAKNKFAQHGLPSEQLSVLNNFAEDPGPPDQRMTREGLLFVGRIDAGKGVELLCRALAERPKLSLTVIGDGPLLAMCKSNAPPNVAFLGTQSAEKVQDAMRQARWLVVPSTWYEGFPMVLAEAFAHGLPAIAADIGGLPEIVQDQKTGILFDAGSLSSLLAGLDQAQANDELAQQCSRQARKDFERYYSPQAHLTGLSTIYAEAMMGVKAQRL